MVSCRHINALHQRHSMGLSEARFTGVFKQVGFGASNLFNGSFFGGPTIPVPSEMGAPRTFAEGISLTLTVIFSHDRFSAIIADQIERNSERDDVLEEKQAQIVHVMDAVNHDGVIRSRDQHGACGEEHAD